MSELIYRTSEPSTIAAAHAAITAREALHQRRADFAREHGTETFMVSRSWMMGLVFEGDLPPGWRAHDGYAVPDKRTKIGKAAHAELKALDEGPAEDIARATGMPSMALATTSRGRIMCRPGFDTADLHADSPVLYATWSASEAADEVEAEVDPARGWQRVPLSVWFARVEARAAAQR